MQLVIAMEPEEKTAEQESEGQNRRTAPRHGLDEEASLLLVNHGSTVSCRVVDLSLSGCCLRTKERFTAGSMVHVEVTFRARGLSFRFSGMTQWTNSRNLVGIRFVNVPMRRREELVEALFEVEAENAAKAARQAAEKQAVEEQAAAQEAAEKQAVEEQAAAQVASVAPVAKRAEEIAQRQTSVQIPALAIGSLAHPLPGALPVSQAKPNKRDRREESREEVDTSAVIHLINIASRLPGRILDLSLGGCRIRADERFPVGIYTRVETEFRVKGLSFRLAGVIQAIHDRERRNIGIRFLDMSIRKHEQVEELIGDIREMREQGQGTRD
jgi:c-di-GMP-binding flagellar brake protein YcgR